MEQDAPPLRTMRDVWDLITGPEASPWSSLLVQDHLGSDGKLSLFQTCRGGRNLVLSTANHATIKVAANRQDHVARMQAIAVTLVARGNLPTKLHLTASAPEQLPSTLGALEAGTTRLDELHVRCHGPLPRHTLATVGLCCRNLRVLDIHATEQQMPSPELFPNLKQLHSRDAAYSRCREFCRTAAPYIKQLTHLTLGSQPDPTLLFSPGTVGAHLHTLKLIRATLDDALLDLILQCAPALEQLKLYGVSLQSDAHVNSRVRWRHLEYTDLHLSSLARLPLTPPGFELVFPGIGVTWQCDVTSLEEAVAARLKDVKFRWTGRPNAKLYLGRGEAITEDQAPAALRSTFALLRSMSREDEPIDTFPAITFHHPRWTMNSQEMQELQGLPCWKKLDFIGAAWLPAQPALYGSLLRWLPDSYSDVTIFCSYGLNAEGLSLTPQQVESICLGAPVNRTPAEGPLRITLKACSDELFEAVQNSMQLCPFPKVVVAQGR